MFPEGPAPAPTLTSTPPFANMLNSPRDICRAPCPSRPYWPLRIQQRHPPQYESEHESVQKPALLAYIG
ncbi:hypothetical protein LY76DRAFT_175593 [Colletotrichum caudatum]|nr:hypothetical protein LY76DRAFT_175593 [Colletotrichum caudatum]